MGRIRYQRSTFGIVLVLLACGVLALAFVHQRGVKKEQAITNLGGEVYYENSAGWLAARFKRAGRPQLARAVDQMFGRIVTVDFGRELDLKDMAPAEVFEALKGAESLQVIMFDGIPLRDADLPRLAELPNLTQVGIANAKATAAGIEALRKQLPKLQIVWQDEGKPVLPE